MQVGDVIHLDGLKAEYSLFGRDRFSACTLPDGDYVIVGFEDDYVNLAWSEAGGGHRGSTDIAWKERPSVRVNPAPKCSWKLSRG
jgi:hypothetical protein